MGGYALVRQAAGSVAQVHAYDVVGIGNALVDVITHADDAFIAREALAKGSMTLIETDQAVALYRAMGSGIEMSGGSAANTMTGISSFGGRAAYIGKVSPDDLGEVFAHDMRAMGVAFGGPAPAGDIPTGRCLIIVTPDAQRTMNTYLGVSSTLGPDDVDDELVAAGKVVFMEGYLFDRPPAKEGYRKAAQVAHANGGKVSLTLSDSFCVDRHRDDFFALVESQVDILFANEDELKSLYQVEDFDDAVQAVRGHCEIAAITRGPAGSIVIAGPDVHVIDAHPVQQVLDTTGAGDLYAAGFLFGLTNGFGLADCGRFGSLAASEVISHVGARPLVPLRRLARLEGRV
jgi:sugar/nucleoside kinase (ribokinase family)